MQSSTATRHVTTTATVAPALLLPLLLQLSLLATGAGGYATGAPGHRCSNLVPFHSAEPQRANSPYRLQLQPWEYGPGDSVNVTLSGISGEKFKGFAIAARRVKGDTEELVGRFVTAFPAKGARWYSSGNSVQNCATHATSSDKDSITVTWIAPAASVGDVVFTTPVVQSLKTFWSNISSQPLVAKVPSADPPVEPIRSGRGGQMSGSCGVEFGCVATPAGCAIDSACSGQVKFRQLHADWLQVEIKAKGSYVAVAFSDDSRMRDDLTITCAAKQKPSIQLGYNPSNRFRNEQHRYTQMRNLSIDVSSDSDDVWCQFSLPIAVQLHTFVNNREEFNTTMRQFDLNKLYYVFIASGDIYTDTSTSVKHREMPAISSSPVNLLSRSSTPAHRIFGYKKGHASLMLVAWMLLAPVAATLGMFFRNLFSVTLWGVQLWFHLHRLLAVSAYAATIAAVLLIFAAFDWQWPASQAISTTHSVQGLVVVAVVSVQILMGMLRPDKDSPRRGAFKVAHQVFGGLAAGLADSNLVIIGYLASLPSTYQTLHQSASITWLVFHAVFKISVSVMLSRWNKGLSDLKDSEKEQQQSKINQRLLVLLGIYLLVALALFMILFVSVNAY